MLPLITTVEFLASDNVSNGTISCINVTIVNDADYEGYHSFMMMIGALSPPALLDAGSAAIIIQDDDGT